MSYSGITALGLCLALTFPVAAQDLPQQASAAMEKAVHYLRSEVAVGGGYLGSYTVDLSDQWGEGHATRNQNWIQPPGCPSVGFAFLRAWEATGDQQYLQAAREVAGALIYGQLECGGWDYIVDHSPEGARAWYYRHNADGEDEALKKGRNRGTFDDNTTQHATRLLMAVDRALQMEDAEVHQAALAALEFHLEAQGDTGGWPQVYPLTGRGYSDFWTFNDNTIADCCDVMMIAHKTYGDERYKASVLRCGRFIIDAQLPEPQRAWAQQYDHDMKPAWARRFEPPAVTAGESGGVMRLLLAIALFTGDEQYLQPLPAALDWYRRSELQGEDRGKWARFYELGTNRPLYMTANTYFLTYDGGNCPDHYSFKGAYFPAAVEQQYNAITQVGPAKYMAQTAPQPASTEDKLARARGMEERVRQLLEAQDERGRWITGDKIVMETFERNIQALADYLRLVSDR